MLNIFDFILSTEIFFPQKNPQKAYGTVNEGENGKEDLMKKYITYIMM